MKTPAEIEKAREVVAYNFAKPGLSDAQRTLLAGMVTALAWVAGDGSSTIEDLMAGRPVIPADAYKGN